MKRIGYLVLFLFGFSLNVIAQYANTKMSLLTCGKGSELYSAFGHSGIRVVDSLADIDIVFNYGAFNSSVNRFYLDFLIAKPTFYLVIVPTDTFINEYKKKRRGIIETKLDLDSNSVKQLVDYLLWNAQEENYAYQYDFIHQNCATKIRDVFEEKLGNTFSFNFTDNSIKKESSFRELLYSKLNNRPAAIVGFILILGKEIDKIATQREQVFLPDNLMSAFQSATLHQHKIAVSKTVLLNGEIDSSNTNLNLIFWSITLLLVILCVLLFIDSRKLHTSLSTLFLFITGFLGVLLILCYFTDNDTTYYNFNLLWAMPLNLLAVALALRKPKLYGLYLKGFGIYLVCLVPIFFFLPQKMNTGLYVWCVLLGIYLWGASKKLSNQGNTPL